VKGQTDDNFNESEDEWFVGGEKVPARADGDMSGKNQEMFNFGKCL